MLQGLIELDQLKGERRDYHGGIGEFAVSAKKEAECSAEFVKTRCQFTPKGLQEYLRVIASRCTPNDIPIIKGRPHYHYHQYLRSPFWDFSLVSSFLFFYLLFSLCFRKLARLELAR